MKGAVVTVGTDGTVEIDAQGFEGKGCEAFNELLAKNLGKVIKDDHKPEWSLPEPSMQTVKERQ